MSTVSRVPHFRRYQPRDDASWWSLTPWVLLGVFDLALWGYIIATLWGTR